eukprot:3129933-Prymnesium_polylepis.1
MLVGNECSMYRAAVRLPLASSQPSKKHVTLSLGGSSRTPTWIGSVQGSRVQGLEAGQDPGP